MAEQETSLFLFIVIGALAGWLAGKLMRGKGFGLVANIFIGILGAILGGMLFQWADIDLGAGFWPSLFTALVGALILVGLGRLLGGGRRR